jgi:hypothetical protein
MRPRHAFIPHFIPHFIDIGHAADQLLAKCRMKCEIECYAIDADHICGHTRLALA